MIKKLRKSWKALLLLGIIISASLFLRLFNAEKLFLYTHDNDLAGWVIKDIVVDKHPRLIGQETSTKGIFIGGLYYYLQIPFYMIFNMDPIGGVYLAATLAVLTTISFYFVFRKIFSKEVGVVAMIIHAVSLYIVFNEREVVPTAPVFLWSVWFLYAIYLLYKGRQLRGFILSAILGALIWHMNFALIIPYLLLPLVVLLSGKKVNLKSLSIGISLLVILNAPLLVFEYRHDFIQTKAFITSFTTDQMDVYHGVGKVVRVFHLIGKNVNSLIFGGATNIKFEAITVAFIFILLLMIYRKIIERKLGIIFLSWLILYIAFFSAYSKIVSEYYLNGAIVVFIAILSVLVGSLLKKNNTRLFGVILISLFCYFNYQKLIDYPVNRSGYYDRKNIVEEIRANAGSKNYPCIAISYITKPGYEFGYRYFFWWFDMHVNKPDSGAPVYTIVFPLRDDIKVDKTFGALGLIYPTYSRYTKEGIEKSCSGENSNLTDPMFGFTK